MKSKLPIRSLPARLGCLFLILVILAVLSLAAVYMLPTGRMQANLDASMEIFFQEDAYPTLLSGGDSYMLDNYTDALMLATAVYDSQNNPITAAIASARLEVKDAASPVQSLIQNYMGTAQQLVTVNYTRYWHGYLIFLKPILLFLKYSQIRKIMAIAQVLVASAVISALAYQKKITYIPAFVLTWLFLNPMSTGASLQYNTVYMLTMLTLLVLILMEKRLRGNRDTMILMFFAVGCLTSFFDLLTYPAVVVGIPLAYIAAESRDGIKKSVCTMLQLGIVWGAGYALMWAAKWILASLILHQNAFQSVILAFSVRISRTGLMEKPISYGDVVRKNYEANPQYIQLACVLTAAGAAICLLRKKKSTLAESIPLLLVAVIPFAWYFMTANHSIIHYFFTFRELAITVFALLLFAGKNLTAGFRR